MVQLLLDELPKAAPEIGIHHVNLALSRTDTDIGRWQPGKLLAARRALRAAHAAIRQSGCDTLYYVPAPGKRIALWRDIMLLSSLRPQVQHLVLHWHASGLGQWLETQAMGWERRAAQRALGGADLSITLAPSLQADTETLRPQNTTVVENGIHDPFAETGPPDRPPPAAATPRRMLFLGTGSVAKGLFHAIAALDHLPSKHTLTFAGAFPDATTAERFATAKAQLGERLTHVGFAAEAERRRLLATHDIMVFPTQYEHEAFPLVLIEALAADLPIVTSPWRAIPHLLPPDFGFFADPTNPIDLADRIQAALAAPPHGRHRSHFLKNYTARAFADRIAAALRQLP